MPKFLLKSLFIVLLLVPGLNPLCQAQYRIPLDSVAKIIMLRSSPFWIGGRFNKVEIIPNNNSWAINQLELHADGTNDVSRKFLRPISKNDLSQLLKLIGNADTVIRPRLFKIDKKRILSEYDTLLPFLKPRQRETIAKKINSTGVLDSMVIDQLHQLESDMSSYVIAIITKHGDTSNISAYANSHIYGHLPWKIGKIKSYDPRISAIFDGIVSGSFENYSIKRFYSQMVFWAYMKYFQTNLALDDLKNDFPIAYQSLITMFKPIIMGDNNSLYNLDPPRPIDSLYYMGGFQAHGLPKYVNLYFNFKPADTTSLNSRIRYVDTIKRYFAKTNFLFKHLETHPAATLRFRPDYTAHNKNLGYNAISKLFTGISAYNLNDIQIVNVVGKADVISTWLLLPDNTVLLCSYLKGWNSNANRNPHFMGLNDNLIKLHIKNSNVVCLHFNADGKLIKNYGEGEDDFFSNY